MRPEHKDKRLLRRMKRRRRFGYRESVNFGGGLCKDKPVSEGARKAPGGNSRWSPPHDADVGVQVR